MSMLFNEREIEEISEDERRSISSHHQELERSLYDAVQRGNDVKLPSYLQNNKVNFWTVSSLLTGASNDANSMLFKACQAATNGRQEEAVERLKEFVQAVAKEYADDNAEELALRCMP